MQCKAAEVSPNGAFNGWIAERDTSAENQIHRVGKKNRGGHFIVSCVSAYAASEGSSTQMEGGCMKRVEARGCGGVNMCCQSTDIKTLKYLAQATHTTVPQAKSGLGLTEGGAIDIV